MLPVKDIEGSPTQNQWILAPHLPGGFYPAWRCNQALGVYFSPACVWWCILQRVSLFCHCSLIMFSRVWVETTFFSLWMFLARHLFWAPDKDTQKRFKESRHFPLYLSVCSIIWQADINNKKVALKSLICLSILHYLFFNVVGRN